MFDKLLKDVSLHISTVKKVIQTNDRLRKIVFRHNPTIEQELAQNTQFAVLIEGVASEQEWLIYDRCAVVTRLYAIYERFVEDLITEWLEYLPKIVTEYSDLEERIKDTHQTGVGRLLTDLKKKRFEHLSINEVIQGLFNGVTGNERYKLIPDAFLLHEQNLRREVLEKLLADAGILNAWEWVDKHREIKQFIEDVRGSQTTAEAVLNELITYRNDAAHGATVDETLGSKELIELGDFIQVLCEALAELVTFEIVNKYNNIGQITEWFKQPKAGVAKVKETTLSVGQNIFLVNKASAYCQLAKIESIMINDVSQEQVVATSEQEVGLKFNIEGKKGLSLYIGLAERKF